MRRSSSWSWGKRDERLVEFGADSVYTGAPCDSPEIERLELAGRVEVVDRSPRTSDDWADGGDCGRRDCGGLVRTYEPVHHELEAGRADGELGEGGCDCTGGSHAEAVPRHGQFSGCMEGWRGTGRGQLLRPRWRREAPAGFVPTRANPGSGPQKSCLGV